MKQRKLFAVIFLAIFITIVFAANRAMAGKGGWGGGGWDYDANESAANTYLQQQSAKSSNPNSSQ